MARDHGANALAGDLAGPLFGVAREADDGGGIPVARVKLRGERRVGGDGDFFAKHQPLTDVGHAFPAPDAGGNRVEPPMDEEAKTGFTPPGEIVAAGDRAAGGAFDGGDVDGAHGKCRASAAEIEVRRSEFGVTAGR